MDINKKLSAFSIFIAVVSVIVSFLIVPRLDLREDLQTGDDITSILSENQAQVELDTKKAELLQNLNRDSQSKFYSDFGNTAEGVNDSVKAKKEELKKYAQEILDKAAACRDDIEKTCNSEGITIVNRLETLKNYDSSEPMKALNQAVANAENTKLTIESEIKAFKEAESKRKAAEQQKSNSSSGSGSSGGSRSSYSNSSGGGSSYGGSSSSGGGGSSSSGSSSSGGGGSSSGGGSSASSSSSSGDDWGGSER